jgi:D-citramalate synthase
MTPERFGRKRQYALGKLLAKANIEKNLQELGLKLNPEDLKLVTQRIIELGDKRKLQRRLTLHHLTFGQSNLSGKI